MSDAFTKRVLLIAIVVFLSITEIAAIVVWAYDTLKGVMAPNTVTNFISMGITYAIAELSHIQGAKIVTDTAAVESTKPKESTVNAKETNSPT
jgi:hypothetical protein